MIKYREKPAAQPAGKCLAFSISGPRQMNSCRSSRQNSPASLHAHRSEVDPVGTASCSRLFKNQLIAVDSDRGSSSVALGNWPRGDSEFQGSQKVLLSKKKVHGSQPRVRKPEIDRFKFRIAYVSDTQILRGSLSAASKTIFASEYSIFSIFRDRQVLHTFAELEAQTGMKKSSKF